MIDGYASESHYLDHLAPVVLAVGGRMLCGATPLLERAQKRWPELHSIPGVPRLPEGPPVLVAGWRDAQHTNRHRKLGLLEHGSGQTYIDALADPHYAGGLGWERAALILSPGPHALSYWEGRFPESDTSPAIVSIKGTPRLDNRAAERGTRGTPENAREAVGVSFHWDCRLCPETKATWREWLPHVEALARRRPVLGHAHPRAWRLLGPTYQRLGVPASSEWDDVLDGCWAYVCDNSSTMYEFAGLGRPVLCLQGARYRAGDDGRHGLRFYDAAPGPLLEHNVGTSLDTAVRLLEGDSPRFRDECLELGALACERAYGLPMFDGRSTERAAAAIKEFLV